MTAESCPNTISNQYFFTKFKNSNPTANVVVEPAWRINERQYRPDLVIVQIEQTTYFFELKSVPHHYAGWKDDIDKLCDYVVAPYEFPVGLNPENGKWEGSAPVHNERRLHFVVISLHDTEAVDT